jgi:hypothetical protein
VDEAAQEVVGGILAALAFLLMGAIALFAWFDNRGAR